MAMKNNSRDTTFDGKTILITGGTGTFGQTFVRVLFNRFRPKKVIVFSRDEFKQYEMQQTFDHTDLRFFIGDVRDRDRLHRAFEGVDLIVHAAALKHVPTAEYNPFEVIKTNVVGAQNVIDIAIDAGVKKIIALSTDKAVSPINLYGAAKLCADKLFISGNSYTGAKDTRFSVVRYGNVIGSRGSVIPLFLKLRNKGVLPVTEKEMTRFWITIMQGIELILNSFRLMKGGEIFVPKVPSASVVDIAKAIAPECKLKFTGIRPGEKLHEVLITEDDGRKTLEYPDHYVIDPRGSNAEHGQGGGKPVRPGFVYSSNNNPTVLSFPALKDIILAYCREDAEYIVR